MNYSKFFFAVALLVSLFFLSCADDKESLSATDKLFGSGNKMPETENPISWAVFSEKPVYVDGKKKDVFCCASLSYEYIAKITPADIEEFCQKISSDTTYKRICISPLFTDTVHKGFVFLNLDNTKLYGYFGAVDREVGAIIKSEWECIYDMTTKKIEIRESEDLSATDKLFGKGKTMPLSANPISQISFVEKDIYFKGEKTGSFCYGLLKDHILAKITLQDIEEFCSMITPQSEFKAICLFPFLNDDVQKGFVFLKVGDFAIHGYFGVFDRQTGAISKSDWECYYDILNKKIEKFEDVN